MEVAFPGVQWRPELRGDGYRAQRDTMKILTDLEKTSSRSTGGLAEPSRCTQRHGVTLDTYEGRGAGGEGESSGGAGQGGNGGRVGWTPVRLGRMSVNSHTSV